MPIMMRPAEDDFAALKTADAMEKAGATVITVTPNGQAQYPTALAPHTRYIVWARVTGDAHIAEVDVAIEAEFPE